MTEQPTLRIMTKGSETYVNVDDLIAFIKVTPRIVEEKVIERAGGKLSMDRDLIMAVVEDICRYFYESLVDGARECEESVQS